jgi:pyruvate dehydrogenase (quinone)
MESMDSKNKPSGWPRRDIFRGAAAAGLAALAPGPVRAGDLVASVSETTSNVVPQPQTASDDNLNTADIIVETLINWGANHAFGIVGDGINFLSSSSSVR